MTRLLTIAFFLNIWGSFAFAQTSKVNPSQYGFGLQPDHIPYDTLRSLGFSRVISKWRSVYHQAYLTLKDGSIYEGQLFYGSDTSIVFYTTTLPYFPDVFPSYHLYVPVSDIQEIRVRKPMSFNDGFTEFFPTLAVSFGVIGTLVADQVGILAGSPAIVLGLGMGVFTAYPISLVWGFVRLLVPFYQTHTIDGSLEAYRNARRKLNRATLFPDAWPPSAPISRLKARPEASKTLRSLPSQWKTLRLASTSYGLSPLMGATFRENLLHLGFGLGGTFGSSIAGYQPGFAASGFSQREVAINPGAIHFTGEYSLKSSWRAGLNFQYQFPESMHVSDNSFALNIRSQRLAFHLSTDYLFLTQDRLSNRMFEWGTGIGIGPYFHLLEGEWTYAQASGRQVKSDFSKSFTTLGAYLQVWGDFYASKSISFRLYGRAHGVIPGKFERLPLYRARSVIAEIQEFRVPTSFIEIGIRTILHD